MALLALVFTTLVLAAASRAAIEKPFHHPGGTRATTWRSAIIVAETGVTAAGAAVVVARAGVPQRVPPLVANVFKSTMTEEGIRQNRCFLSPPDSGDKLAGECFTSAAAGPEVLLFGDSHAAHLWPGFSHAPALKSFKRTHVTAGACPPLLLDQPEKAPTRDPGAGVFDPVTGIVVHCASITARTFQHIAQARQTGTAAVT